MRDDDYIILILCRAGVVFPSNSCQKKNHITVSAMVRKSQHVHHPADDENRIVVATTARVVLYFHMIAAHTAALRSSGAMGIVNVVGDCR